jgi:small subunit ribosomal protein S4
MARHIGPTTKVARTFGEAIFGYDKSFEKRNYPPGQHGVSKRRKTVSEFGVQLKEKQKAKMTYGLLERQFSNVYRAAARKSGVTGEIMLQMLESRLDNVVYRLGIAPTRRAARQLVGHKHIAVNGSICNIPSAQLRAGDKISVRARSTDNIAITTSVHSKGMKFSWLTWEDSSMSGTYLNHPERDQIPENIKEQLIVELYSK